MDTGLSLFRDGTDRERILDMDRRLRPERRMAFGVVAVALLLFGPWLGWWTVIPVAVAAVGLRIADSQSRAPRTPRVRDPRRLGRRLL